MKLKLYPNQIKAIKEFEQAVRAHEMIGAAHPAERAEIDATYKLAKAKLNTVFVKLNAEIDSAYEQ